MPGCRITQGQGLVSAFICSTADPYRFYSNFIPDASIVASVRVRLSVPVVNVGLVDVDEGVALGAPTEVLL